VHRRKLEAEYEAVHLSPTVAAERGYIDAVIEPADTRRAVAGALAALAAKREQLPRRRHENIPL
jgi:propionyl-CoA carboxylase beta chain